MATDRGPTLGEPPAIESETYPADCCAASVEQWITWKPSDDGRKIPRAPYANPGRPDRYVSAQDADVWTDFETARDWARKLPGHRLAFTIRDRDVYPDEELVLVDYDDVRDPDTGTLHPTVREHLTQADSYADVSPSGTGVHLLCRGALPDSVKTIADTLPAADAFPEAKIEVYDSARFVTMTGRHLQATPPDTRPCQALLADLVDTYATVVEGTPDELLGEPATSKAELAALETTDDMQDVFDAIAQIGPTDIRLDSPVTENRNDGSKSRDPAWTTSESGTRLAEVDGAWIYREGMIGLDALQVVALEEGIIRDERTYPQGNDFWDAVDALRDRGAHIPSYQPSGQGVAVESNPAGTARASMDAPEDVELALEAKLLRERVAEQQARIDELEAALAEREATIDDQRERLATLAATDEELTDEESPDDDPGLWTVVKRWFTGR
jgi:putative DNA primase/helicase